MNQLRTIFSIICTWAIVAAWAQNPATFSLSEDGSQYLTFTGLAQVWVRHTEMNPGTSISGYPVNEYSDISIRRLRFQLIGQLTPRVFFYAQFGQNNFKFFSEKYTGAFFHDVVTEYAVKPGAISIGAGLTSWGGPTRYAAPSVASLLTLDAPLYQQATNGLNDQFIRRLSVYAKGQFGRLDYRVAVSQPFTVTDAPTSATTPTSERFSFSNEPPRKQLQTYFKWMFWDKEANRVPYEVGSYLGKKRILSLGGGVVYQPQATWALDARGQVVRNQMLLAGLDIFYDSPLANGSVLTTYLAVTNYDFGAGFVRNIGVDNSATGSNGANPGGFGNAFPMVGTGGTVYAQVGWMPAANLTADGGRMQPFAAMQYSNFDYLNEGMVMYEVGSNYFIHGGHGSKVSVMYQSRPIYANVNTRNVQNGRKGMAVLQYQLAF